jgi:hypothetical protein
MGVGAAARHAAQRRAPKRKTLDEPRSIQRKIKDFYECLVLVGTKEENYFFFFAAFFFAFFFAAMGMTPLDEPGCPGLPQGASVLASDWRVPLPPRLRSEVLPTDRLYTH